MLFLWNTVCAGFRIDFRGVIQQNIVFRLNANPLFIKAVPWRQLTILTKAVDKRATLQHNHHHSSTSTWNRSPWRSPRLWPNALRARGPFAFLLLERFYEWTVFHSYVQLAKGKFILVWDGLGSLQPSSWLTSGSETLLSCKIHAHISCYDWVYILLHWHIIYNEHLSSLPGPLQEYRNKIWSAQICFIIRKSNVAMESPPSYRCFSNQSFPF